MSRLGIEMASEDGRGTRAQRHGRRRRRRRRRRSLLALVLAFAVVGALGGALFLGGRALVDKGHELFGAAADYTGEGTGSVVVEVLPGQGPKAVGDTLEQAGVVKSAEAYEDACAADLRWQGIQPGTYALRSQMSGAAALALLLEPTTRQINKLTVPEGLRLTETLDTVAEKGGFDRAQLEAALVDPAIGLPAYAGGNAEGYLFPATYELDAAATPVSVLTEMVETFGTVAAEVGLEAKAAALGLTPAQVVVVASIVQAEGRDTEDYGKIARVLYNRLAAGIPLQLDTTVDYANGTRQTRTTEQDRAVDSPYNTYKVPGLPPGPISHPGRAALEAALNPTPGDWRFFVAVNLETGETKYAVTAEEHAANVEELNAWCRTSDVC